MKKKHKVLSWWATLLLTFAAFVGVIGVTVLVMYLTGQFNKVVVWPEDMTFSTDVDGAGFFDGEGNLFVATNFSRESTKPATSVFLTISTTTQEVTEDEVTLFLDGDRTKTSNGVITVPQTIRLNKPFEVKLDVTDGYVNGGTAVITAVSADQTLERQTLKVFVDKPVESFDVQISGGEKDSDGQFNVVTGATFNFQTLFTPQESAKAFSQEDAQKQVFFHNTSAYIDYDWENHNFFTQKQSGEAFDEVTFYVFANAAFQNQVLDRFSDLVNQPSMYNSSVITYLTQNFQESENTYLTKTINVHVKNATVTYVNIDKAGGTIDGGTRDKYFTLTARSASGDNTDSLGINIRENATSSNLDGLLGNVGIKIDKNDSSLILDNRRIDQLNVAGYVMKVVSNVSSQGTTYQITKELFDKTNYQKYLTAPAGTEYYILPCTSPTYATEYYWRIAATDVLPHTLHVNFFFEDASGRYANFFAFDPSAENAEKTVTYVAEDHPQEPAAWTNRNTVDLEIAYDEEGLAQNAQVTLSDYVQEIASTNVYTKTKFFLFVNNTDTHNISFDATEAFNVQPAKTYQQDYLGEELNIWGFANAAGYQLFEVDSDDLLIAKIRVPEKVEVYALIAIIQTDVDGKILLDNAGNYKIVNLSDLKRVRVDSALSVSNMTPVFTFTQVVPQDMASQIYYIPSAIRGEDGNQSIIRFTLQYNCGENSDAEDWARDARKIASAFDTRTLQVVCTDAQGVILDAPYVSMSSSPREMFEVDGQPGQLTATGTRKQTLYFVGEIAITKELFAYSASENTVTSMDIYLHLKFNNGRDDFDKSITKEGEATCNHFVVYYQTPQTLTADFMRDPINGDTDISVTIGQGGSGTGQVTLQWGRYSLQNSPTDPRQPLTIPELLNFINGKLNFTITDEHGQEIDTNPDTGLYRIMFREEGTANLLRFNPTSNALQNFDATKSGENKTKLVVEIMENVPDGRIISNLTQQFDFTITGEGVTKVEQENDGQVLDSDLSVEENYHTSADTAQVEIRKDIAPGTDQISLKKLLRVYIGTSGDFYQGDMRVRLDSTFITTLSDQDSQDLAKMLRFDIDDAAEAKENMREYLDQDLDWLTLRYPFNADTTLSFVVTDTNATMFSVALNLVIRKQVNIVNGFDSYNQQKGYSDYLVKLGNVTPALFADNQYDISELFQLTNPKVGQVGTDYSWTNGLSGEDLLVTDSSLLTVEQEGENYVLKIGNVTRFDTVTFTLYYGVQSSFALNTGDITLYINPNIAIVERNIPTGKNAPFVNLNKLSDTEVGGEGLLSTNFVFCKATSYIDNVVNGTQKLEDLQGSDLVDIITSPWTFTNVTPKQNGNDRDFINIGTIGSNADRKFAYLFNRTAPNLSLKLGENFVQNFRIKTSGDDMHAVRVQEVGQGADVQRKIILCKDENGNLKNVEISIELGFGEDEYQTIRAILYRRSNQPGGALAPEQKDVQIVTLSTQEGAQHVLKTYVLLAQSEYYNIKDGFNFAGSTGYIINGSANQIFTGAMTEFFSSNNTLTVSASPTDANGGALQNLTLTINAIISRIGEKFVLYGNDDKFNVFEDAEFWALLQDPASVGAFQELEAGKKYKLFHTLDLAGGIETEEDMTYGTYGFYYDQQKSGAENGSRRAVTTEVYRLVNGQKTIMRLSDIGTFVDKEGKLTGSLDYLQLNHVSTEYDNTFIEISLPFRHNGNVFTYKYRIKVLPDFAPGSMAYPFADDAEYLDSLQPSYVGQGTYQDGSQQKTGFGNYQINLDEVLDNTNSKFGGEAHRFTSPTALKGNLDDLVGTYNLSAAYVNNFSVDLANNAYFTYTLDGSNLSVTLKQANVQIELNIEKSFTAGGIRLFGGELTYRLCFNMGSPYATYVDRSKVNGTYEATLTANAGENTFAIDLLMGEGVQTRISDFDFIIKAKDGKISDALSAYELKDDGSNGKVLAVTPLQDVAKNVTIEIGIYPKEGMSQRVVLKFEILVTGFYQFQVGENFVGGTEYSFFGEHGIFTQLDDISDGVHSLSQPSATQNYSVALSLTDGAEKVTFGAVEVEKHALLKISQQTAGDSTDLSASKIEFAHLPAGVTFNFQAVITRKVTGGASSSYTFNFSLDVAQSVNVSDILHADLGTVYGGVKYVLGMYDVSDGDVTSEDAFGKQDKLVEKAKFALKGTSGEYAFAEQEEVPYTNLDGGVAEWMTSAPSERQKLTFVPMFVGGYTESSKDFYVTYTFKNGQKNVDGSDVAFSLTFVLNLTFQIMPSVDVQLHTPAPDQKTHTNVEYLTTAVEASTSSNYDVLIDNFFNTQTEFAMKDGSSVLPRVTVKNVEALKAYSLQKQWTIFVAKLENVNLAVEYVGSGHTNRVIKPENFTADGSLLDAEAAQNIRLTFSLVDPTNDGRVEFGIMVNGVRATLKGQNSNYVVQVMRVGSAAVGVVRNATNYVNDSETIYAEDIATYSDKRIFGDDRIVQFNAKQAGTYHLKFVDDGSVIKHVVVTAPTANVVVNADVGEPLTGFHLDGVYRTYDRTGGFMEQLNLENTFNVLPTVTSRLVAMYALGTSDEMPIVFDDTMQFVLAREIVVDEDTTTRVLTKASDLVLTNKEAANGDEGVKYDVIIAKGGIQNAILTSGTYNVHLTIDFGITGVAENGDGSDNLTLEIVAGHDYVLLGDGGANTLNNQLHIRSTRRGTDYTREMMRQGSGNFDLKIYGFADTPIVTDTKPVDQLPSTWTQREIDLAVSAGQIHESLISTPVTLANKDTIYYFTGLTPRANGFAINGENNQANTYNYLTTIGQVDTQQGEASSSREIDYTISAQGASNDGNHVMVKVIYSVDMGGSDESIISEYHNILFRVVPNSMNGYVAANQNDTSISFKQNYTSDSGVVMADVSRTFGLRHTVANNYANPFVITNDQILKQGKNAFFNLVNTDVDGVEKATDAIERSVVTANMFGGKTNSAREFTFEFGRDQTVVTDGVTTKHNDLLDALNFGTGWNSTASGWWKGTSTADSGTYKLSVGLAGDIVELGEKLYYIDFENKFGFTGRFFFKIVASSKPTIKSSSTSLLVEGDSIAVGTEFRVITTQTDNAGFVQYSSFKYVKGHDELRTGSSASTIKVVAQLATSADGVWMLTKSQSASASTSWKINDDGNNWKTEADIKKDNVTEDMLEGATITVYVKYVGDAKDASLRYGTSKSGSFVDIVDETKGTEDPCKPITLLFKEDPSYAQPDFSNPDSEDGLANIHTVTLANFPAYGFEKDTPVDDAMKQQFVSSLDDIKVARIEFWHGGKLIDTSTNNTQGTTLITGENHQFYDGSSFSVGKKLVQSLLFKVPYIAPRLFGHGQILNDVTMNIVLSKKLPRGGTVEAVLSKQVSISREEEDLFGTEGKAKDLRDGDSPMPTYTGDVLNDTLEVELDPGESTTFILLHDVKFTQSSQPDAVFDQGVVTFKNYNGKTIKTTPITLTNNTDYVQTQYISITDNLIDMDDKEENLAEGDSFYIYRFTKLNPRVQVVPRDAVFAYNGARDDGTSTKTLSVGCLRWGNMGKVQIRQAVDVCQGNTIEKYGTSDIGIANASLRMYIPSVKALGSEKTMSRKLFFLYEKNEKIYQFAQDFTIHPEYSFATKQNLTASGDTIEVSDYYQLQNGTSETFYAVPLRGWAGKTDSFGGDVHVSDFNRENSTSLATGIQPYEFNFVISSTDPSGSAFVDEFGTLSTSRNFTISDDLLLLTIYVKVSGADGNFEESNTILELAKFSIRLVPKFGDPVLISGQNTQRTFVNGDSFVMLPSNWTLRGSAGSLSTSNALQTTTKNLGTYACNVGSVIDFSQLLKDKDAEIGITGNANKVYHVLKVGSDEIYCRDNINHWTFSEAGQQQVTLLVTSRDPATSDYAWQLCTLTMHVFGTDTIQQNSIALRLEDAETVEYNLLRLQSGDGTWFVFDENTNAVQRIDRRMGSSGNVAPLSLNKADGAIQEKTLIFSSSDKYIVHKATFYLYEEGTKPISVALTVGQSCNLQSLVKDLFETTEDGTTYQFRSFGGNNGEVLNANAIYVAKGGSGNSVKENFLIVATDSHGKVTVQSAQISFKTISSTVDSTAGMFVTRQKTPATEKGKPDKFFVEADAIKGKIRQVLQIPDGTSETEGGTRAFYTIQTRASTGVLSGIGSQIEVSSANQERQEFVVTYRLAADGPIRIKRVALLLYFHENENEIEVTVDKLGESVPFALANVNQQVLDAINAHLSASDDGEVSGVVAYYTLDEKTGMLSVMDRISKLERGVAGSPDFEGQFLVTVSGRSFIIRLKLYVDAVGTSDP